MMLSRVLLQFLIVDRWNMKKQAGNVVEQTIRFIRTLGLYCLNPVHDYCNGHQSRGATGMGVQVNMTHEPFPHHCSHKIPCEDECGFPSQI